MSTFSRDNGPYEGFNAIVWKKYIDELRTDVTRLQNILRVQDFTVEATVRSEIDKVQVDLDAAKIRLNNFSNSLTTANLDVPDFIETLTEESKKVLQIKTLLKGLNIEADNIAAGPVLGFDKYYTPSMYISSDAVEKYYAIAELNRVTDRQTNDPTITLPSIVFLYNQDDPHVSAIVQATENGIAVLHSGRNFASTQPAPIVKYAIFRTGQEANYHYYLGLHLIKGGETPGPVAANLKVALINALPVTENITGISANDKPVAKVESSEEAAFLVTKLKITSLDVNNLNVAEKLTAAETETGTLSVAGAASFSTDATIAGDVSIAGDVDILGDTTVRNLDVEGTFSIDPTTELDVAAIEANTVKALQSVSSPIYQDSTGKRLIADDEGVVKVGNTDSPLELYGNDTHPSYGINNDKIALLKDIAGSIIYQGRLDLYTNTVPSDIPDPFPTKSDGTGLTPIRDGAVCLVIKTSEEFAKAYTQIYTAATKTWSDPVEIPAPAHEKTYQWHIDHLRENDGFYTDSFYHEAEVLWNPELSGASRLSIINLPLEDYYTIEQVNELIDNDLDLSTRQADWLANSKTVPDHFDKLVDNPAYIRNKPVTGMSVLDGGAFTDQPHAQYPQYIVDGGAFNVLGNSRGKYGSEMVLPKTTTENWAVNDYAYVDQDMSGTGGISRYKISAISPAYDASKPDQVRQVTWERDKEVSDLPAIRREVVVRVWTGLRKDLPVAKPDTRNVLKWCEDSKELFMDMGGDPNNNDKKLVRGNKRLNNLYERDIQNATIEHGNSTTQLWWDNSEYKNFVIPMDIYDAESTDPDITTETAIKLLKPTWEFRAHDECQDRLVFQVDTVPDTPVLAPSKVVTVRFYLHDILYAINHVSVDKITATVIKDEEEVTDGSVSVKWTNHAIYQDEDGNVPGNVTPTPAAPDKIDEFQLHPIEGIKFVSTESAPDAPVLTKTNIGLDEPTLNALNTNVIIDSSLSISNYNDHKRVDLSVTKNKTYKHDPDTDVVQEVHIVGLAKEVYLDGNKEADTDSGLDKYNAIINLDPLVRNALHKQTVTDSAVTYTGGQPTKEADSASLEVTLTDNYLTAGTDEAPEPPTPDKKQHITFEPIIGYGDAKEIMLKKKSDDDADKNTVLIGVGPAVKDRLNTDEATISAINKTKILTEAIITPPPAPQPDEDPESGPIELNFIHSDELTDPEARDDYKFGIDPGDGIAITNSTDSVSGRAKISVNPAFKTVLNNKVATGIDFNFSTDLTKLTTIVEKVNLMTGVIDTDNRMITGAGDGIKLTLVDQPPVPKTAFIRLDDSGVSAGTEITLTMNGIDSATVTGIRQGNLVQLTLAITPSAGQTPYGTLSPALDAKYHPAVEYYVNRLDIGYFYRVQTDGQIYVEITQPTSIQETIMFFAGMSGA
jgi:hypothetical protein